MVAMVARRYVDESVSLEAFQPDSATAQHTAPKRRSQCTTNTDDSYWDILRLELDALHL